jgi:hypothetical protein
VGHVATVGYGTGSGRLTVCPGVGGLGDEDASGSTRIVDAVNKAAGWTVVRVLRILAPGSVAVPEPDDDALTGPAGAGAAKIWCAGPTEPGNVFVMFFQAPIYE